METTTYHFIVLDIVTLAINTVLTIVWHTEAQSDVVLTGQPLVLGAHDQPREAELAHDLYFTTRPTSNVD